MQGSNKAGIDWTLLLFMGVWRVKACCAICRQRTVYTGAQHDKGEGHAQGYPRVMTAYELRTTSERAELSVPFQVAGETYENLLQYPKHLVNAVRGRPLSIT